MTGKRIIASLQDAVEGRASLVPVDGVPPVEPVKPAIDADRDLVKEIAMDIGKSVVAHIEVQYPAMFEAVAGTAKLSIRNCVYNEIMAALEVNDAEAIRRRLEERKKFRRKWTKAYRDLRRTSGKGGEA